MKKSLFVGIFVWLIATTVLILLVFKPVEKTKKIEPVQPTQAAFKTKDGSDIWLPENGRVIFLDRLLFIEGNIKERLIRELKIEVKRYKNQGLDFLKNDIWLSYIKKELNKAKIHPDLIYLPIIESTMKPTAVSSAGAGGYWQLMPGTASFYGLKTNSYTDERFDPVKSTSIAIKHIRYLNNKFGDWTATVGGYNMDPAALQEIMNKKNTSNFYDLQDIPEETQRFPFRILANKLIFENPEKYGFSRIGWLKENAYDNWQIVVISLIIQKESSIEEIVREINVDFPNLKISDFKRFNPQILGDKLPRGNFTAYILNRNGTS